MEDIEIDAVAAMIRKMIADSTYKLRYATWRGAEDVDSDLSWISFSEGGEAHFIPKLKSVTSLSAGSTVLCVTGPGIVLTIIGIISGDVTLASV